MCDHTSKHIHLRLRALGIASSSALVCEDLEHEISFLLIVEESEPRANEDLYLYNIFCTGKKSNPLNVSKITHIRYHLFLFCLLLYIIILLEISSRRREAHEQK